MISPHEAIRMRKLSVLAFALLALPRVTPCQSVADSLSYVVVNHGRPAGSMDVRYFGDSTLVRFQYVDRNRGPRVATTYRFNGKGALSSMTARGLGVDFFQTEVGERFWTDAKLSHWKGDADSGQVALDDSAFYRAVTPTPFDDAALARFLLRKNSRTAHILPAGSASASILLDTTVSAGTDRRHIRLVSIKGLYVYPVQLWLDDQDRLFSRHLSGSRR
jgi:hypothetical protein